VKMTESRRIHSFYRQLDVARLLTCNYVHPDLTHASSQVE
jgi:hypothetical protein